MRRIFLISTRVAASFSHWEATEKVKNFSFFLFYSSIEKLCQTVAVPVDVRIVEKKMEIEFFTDSHVERKKSNKNFQKSGLKHVREKNVQSRRSIMQEFVEIISLQVSTMAWYIPLKFLIGVLCIYLARSR